MAYQLPQQQPVAGTYMEVEVIQWLIKSQLVSGQQEAKTAEVWNEILHIEFPATSGYTTSPQTFINGRPADLFTAHYVFEGRAKTYKFLIVECKAPGGETQGQVWRDAVEQLEAYLSGIANPNQGRRRKFGAIAVGKVVRFYEWNWGTSSIQDLGDGSVYYLDRECQTVARWLRYIRDNHQ